MTPDCGVPMLLRLVPFSLGDTNTADDGAVLVPEGPLLGVC